jgi:hypothetical protein
MPAISFESLFSYFWPMHKLKSIFAIFFLFVFLFTLAQGEVHAFHHSNDFHCTANNAVHFHEAEHHCTICDFTDNLSLSPSFNYQNLSLHELCVLSFFFSENNYFYYEKNFLSLRAPPLPV